MILHCNHIAINCLEMKEKSISFTFTLRLKVFPVCRFSDLNLPCIMPTLNISEADSISLLGAILEHWRSKEQSR